MITALISTLTGLVSGTVPKLLKEWGASRKHGREVEMLKKHRPCDTQVIHKSYPRY